jgi:hypothetical protein
VFSTKKHSQHQHSSWLPTTNVIRPRTVSTSRIFRSRRACLSHQPLALRASDYQTISVHAWAVRAWDDVCHKSAALAQIYRSVQTLQLASHEMPESPTDFWLSYYMAKFGEITKRGLFCCFVVEIERNRRARGASVCGRARSLECVCVRCFLRTGLSAACLTGSRWKMCIYV